MKSTRGFLSMETRCLVKERQGNVCSICGEDSMLELDHIKPLRLGGTDDLSNVHAICTACHLTKTYQEDLLGKVKFDPLVSVLNSHVHDSFHMSTKTPQCVLPLRELKGYAVEIDAVRSRRNALYQNEHPLPVYNVFDEITPAVQGRLADYAFVDKGDVAWGTGLLAMRFLPYTGARWYWKAAVQDRLDRQIVTWEDIKLSLAAAAHLPADTLRTAFETMESSLHIVLTCCGAAWDG